MIGALAIQWFLRRKFAEVMNRRDPAEWLRFCTTDVEEIYPGRTEVSGRFVGRAEFADWARRGFLEDMKDVKFTLKHLAVEKPWALGFTNTVAVEWDVEIQAARDGGTYRMSGASFMDLTRGKMRSSRDYPADHQVIEAVHGIKMVPPHDPASLDRGPEPLHPS